MKCLYVTQKRNYILQSYRKPCMQSKQNIHIMKKVRGVIIAAAVMISFVVGCAGYMISSKLIKSRYTVVIHEPVVVESRAIQE